MRLLLRQCLPIRGHKEDYGNLRQLLKLRSEDCPSIEMWLKDNDYLFPVIINDQITLTGNNLLYCPNYIQQSGFQLWLMRPEMLLIINNSVFVFDGLKTA